MKSHLAWPGQTSPRRQCSELEKELGSVHRLLCDVQRRQSRQVQAIADAVDERLEALACA